MARAESGLEAFLEWQERLKRFESSGLTIDKFCRREKVAREQFAKWLLAVRGKSLEEAEATRSEKRSAFVPVTVRTQFIEILLPGGGLLRLSAGIDRDFLIDIVQLVSTVLQESQA